MCLGLIVTLRVRLWTEGASWRLENEGAFGISGSPGAEPRDTGPVCRPLIYEEILMNVVLQGATLLRQCKFASKLNNQILDEDQIFAYFPNLH